MLKTLICLRKLEFFIIGKNQKNVVDCGFGIMIIMLFTFGYIKVFLRAAGGRRGQNLYYTISSPFCQAFFMKIFMKIFFMKFTFSENFFHFSETIFRKKFFFHFLSENFYIVFSILTPILKIAVYVFF